MSRFSRSKRTQLVLNVAVLAALAITIVSPGGLKWIPFGAAVALSLASLVLRFRSREGLAVPSERLDVEHRPAEDEASSRPKKKYAANLKADDGRWTGGRIRLDRRELEFVPTILEQVWAREGWTTPWHDITEVGVCDCMPKLIGSGLVECMYLTTSRGDYQLFRVFDPQRVAIAVRRRIEDNGGTVS